MTSFAGFNVNQLGVARSIAIALGGLSTVVGARALLDPAGYAALFGVPPSSPLVKDAARNPFIAAAGGSRFSGGLAMLAALYLKLDKAVAVSLMLGSVVGVLDGLALNKAVDAFDDQAGVKTSQHAREVEASRSQAWGHMMFGPIAAGIGFWLWHASSAL